MSWVLLRDFDRKIEDAPSRCEICATPYDRRPKRQSRPRLSGTACSFRRRRTLLVKNYECTNFTAIRCYFRLSILQRYKRRKYCLKQCSLLTNRDICHRKMVADLYEPNDTKRILLKPIRAGQFKQSAYFLNRLRIYTAKSKINKSGSSLSGSIDI